MMIRSLFVGGSRIGTSADLPETIMRALDWYMQYEVQIHVGDACGADLIFQRYLARANYEEVTVFHSAVRPRNIVVKHWKTIPVGVDSGLTGRALMTLKDVEMVRRSEAGLMLWDPISLNRYGKWQVSKGTLSNCANLVTAGKEVQVYLQPNEKSAREREMVNLETPQDLRKWLGLLNELARDHEEKVKYSRVAAAGEEALAVAAKRLASGELGEENNGDFGEQLLLRF